MISINPDAYLKEVLEKYKLTPIKSHLIVEKLKPIIGPWAGNYFNDIIIMGSNANGTLIKKDKEDVDLLISFRSDTPYTVEELYNSLYERLKSKGYKVKLRNISMRFEFNGLLVDLVPAIKNPGQTDYHTVWSRRLNKELPSNTQMHIDIVKSSGLLNEMKLLKIFCDIHKVKLDGFYGNLLTIEALKNSSPGDLEHNFTTLLKWISNRMLTTKFKDPAYDKDYIDENMEPEEKQAVVKLAKKALKMDNWNELFE